MNGARMLLIEDEPALARGLSDTLRANGFDVTVVADGAPRPRRRRRWRRGSDPARRDAAEGERLRDLPGGSRPGTRGADSDADGQGTGSRTSCSASTSGPTTTSPSRSGWGSWWRACAPCCDDAQAGRRSRAVRRLRDRSPGATRGPRRQGGRPDRQGVRAPAVFREPAGPRVIARRHPERRVGACGVRDAAQHRPVRDHAARQGRAESASPHLHSDDPRYRLPVRAYGVDCWRGARPHAHPSDGRRTPLRFITPLSSKSRRGLPLITTRCSALKRCRIDAASLERRGGEPLAGVETPIVTLDREQRMWRHHLELVDDALDLDEASRVVCGIGMVGGSPAACHGGEDGHCKMVRFTSLSCSAGGSRMRRDYGRVVTGLLRRQRSPSTLARP